MRYGLLGRCRPQGGNAGSPSDTCFYGLPNATTNGTLDHAQRCSYNRTLQNVGNTCFFTSVLKVVASIHPFLAEIARKPLPPDYAEDSFCLAFLKLFIPAIAEHSLVPNTELNIPSVRNGELPTCHEPGMRVGLTLFSGLRDGMTQSILLEAL